MPAKRAGELGDYLRKLRTASGLKLREVEQRSNNSVSNAYLSQLESGQARNPAPHVLHALAAVYGVPYERLMRLAGYLGKTDPSKKQPRHSLPTLATKDLTADEEKKMLEYLAFLRSQRKKS